MTLNSFSSTFFLFCGKLFDLFTTSSKIYEIKWYKFSVYQFCYVNLNSSCNIHRWRLEQSCSCYHHHHSRIQVTFWSSSWPGCSRVHHWAPLVPRLVLPGRGITPHPGPLLQPPSNVDRLAGEGCEKLLWALPIMPRSSILQFVAMVFVCVQPGLHLSIPNLHNMLQNQFHADKELTALQ